MRWFVCCWMLVAVSGLNAQAPADIEFFEKKVRPVLVERCFSCHSASAKKVRGGLLLDSRTGALKGGDSGPALVPGDPDQSLLVKAVGYLDGNLQMPPSGKLPAGDAAVLTAWIRGGAPFPMARDSKVAKTAVNIDEGRKFWSFQPPRPTAPPPTKDKAWARMPIDAFILAELEKHGLTPAAAAARGVLLRRATFDLIGLPPSPEEIRAFESDQRPDAYARLVDRLLASPQYGERWGRFWLDLVRYCDIGEPWLESKGQPYLYRDWVVQAFNDDMPYDQFVHKQLAADLLPDARPADWAALGLLGLSPTYWKELKLDKDVIKTVVAEEWEERIATVSGTFLGLTVACARCHDHKFDPITTQDYYGLAGIFASIRPADRPLVPDAEVKAFRTAHGQVRELQKELDKLKAKKDAEAPKQAEALKTKIAALKSATPHFDAPVASGVEEASLLVLADGPYRTRLEYKMGIAQDVAVQIRGNPANPGPLVPRRFLSVLSPSAPVPFRQGSGRLELAQALTREAAPLTARVLVNRVWKHHFGRGLVETPSDFGAQGDRPSHPELLDDLTARFIAAGWSIKWLHREIMLAATYRQSSRSAPAEATDPENRWLGRMPRRRLEVEAWRDAMLAVTGTLDPRRGGPSQELGDPNNTRRTLYGTVKRRELNDLLRLHDFPDPTIHSPNRLPTTTPLQQLYTLNSPFLRQKALALAKRLKTDAPATDEARIQRAYILLFGRPATAHQVQLGLDFLTPPSEAAWAQYAQVLLGSNEFLFVD